MTKEITAEPIKQIELLLGEIEKTRTDMLPFKFIPVKFSVLEQLYYAKNFTNILAPELHETLDDFLKKVSVLENLFMTDGSSTENFITIVEPNVLPKKKDILFSSMAKRCIKEKKINEIVLLQWANLEFFFPAIEKLYSEGD